MTSGTSEHEETAGSFTHRVHTAATPVSVTGRAQERRERLLPPFGPAKGRVRRKQRSLSAELDGIDHALDRFKVEATA